MQFSPCLFLDVFTSLPSLPSPTSLRIYEYSGTLGDFFPSTTFLFPTFPFAPYGAWFSLPLGYFLYTSPGIALMRVPLLVMDYSPQTTLPFLCNFFPSLTLFHILFFSYPLLSGGIVLSPPTLCDPILTRTSTSSPP